MKRLRIIGNQIVDESGSEVILKGININSPCILKYEEHHDFLDDIRAIKALGANAVRVPICPAYFQSREKYCEEILDPIVLLCKELDLFCILDWHGQGNTVTGETRQPDSLIEGYMKYDARPEIAHNAAKVLSERYGKDPHVLFEIISVFYLGINDEEWSRFASSLVETIRKYSDNIVLVAGMDWPHNLNALLNTSVVGENIAFGVMIYPGSKKEDIQNIVKLKERYVIIVTECGYERLQPKQEMMKSTREEYAVPFKDLVLTHHLSWFAWCYHHTRQPVMLRSWDAHDYSEWGTFVKDELLPG